MLFVRHRELGQPIGDLALCDHVACAVVLKQTPLLPVMDRLVASPVHVCFGRFAGDAEVSDQGTAAALLLLILWQANDLAHVSEITRQPQIQGMHASASPLHRVQRSAEMPTQTSQFKRCVVRSLDDIGIEDCRLDLWWY